MRVGTLNTMFRAYEPKEMAERIAAFGIKEVQLDMAFGGKNYDVDELTEDFCSEVAKNFEDKGIKILAVSGHTKIAYKDADEQKAAVDCFLKKLVLPKRFGCDIIVSETGSANPENAWVDHEYNYLPEVWDGAVKALKTICTQAADLGVTFGLEPHFGQLTKNPKTIRQMLDDVACDNFKVTLDTANMVIEKDAEDSHPLIDEVFELLGNDLALVHAKDTAFPNGRSTFVPAGTGVLDYAYFVGKLKKTSYQGPILLEYVSEPKFQEAYDFVNGLL